MSKTIQSWSKKIQQLTTKAPNIGALVKLSKSYCDYDLYQDDIFIVMGVSVEYDQKFFINISVCNAQNLNQKSGYLDQLTMRDIVLVRNK